MDSESDWGPAGFSERVRAIDILRGLSLFGVLIVNILSDFRVPLLEHILKPYAGSRGTDRLVELCVAFALEFKALTIFSFLFGAGVAIQLERAAARHVSARGFLLKRLAWLLVLGATHLVLVWNGDILTLYAICGLLLLTLLGLPSPILTVLGGSLIVLPEFVSMGWSLPSGPAALAAIAQARQVYGHGGFPETLNFRWHETWTLIVPILLSILPRTTGLMCWGAATWRSGVMREPEQHRGKLCVVLTIGATIGGAITVNEVWAASSGRAVWPALRDTHVDASVLLASAWVSAFLLCLTLPRWKPRRAYLLPRLAAMGQLALTNYVLQSILLGYLFYGYGFGLFGRIGSAAAAGIGVAIYVAQVHLSHFWMGRFRYGPLEWLWRSLTYGRRLPMRRARTPGSPP